MDGGVEVDVTVVPRASKTRVVGALGGRLKVQLTAPPVDGAANEALLALFCEVFGLAKAKVTLVGGAKSKKKSVRVEGVSFDHARAELGPEKA